MIDAAEKTILNANLLLAKGLVAECVQELSTLLARQPEHGRSNALLGHLQLRYFKDFAAAEEAFKIAMRNAASFPDLYIDYAFLLLQVERYTETIAVINKGLEVPGISKDKLFQIFGHLYERQSKWDDAVEYYTQALLYTLNNESLKEYEVDIVRVGVKRGRI
jgi:tetratricopeptide (TPR) repeat protein